MFNLYKMRNIFYGGYGEWDKERRMERVGMDIKLRRISLFLTEVDFYEKFSQDSFEEIIQKARKDENFSEMIKRKYDENDLYYYFHCNYDNQLEHLYDIYKKLRGDTLVVKYERILGFFLGRVIAKDLISSNAFYNKVKKPMTKDDYYEFDLKSCYLTLTANLSYMMDMECPLLIFLMRNRDRIYGDIKRVYKLGDDDAGNDFCKKLVFLSFYNPCEEEYKVLYDKMKIDYSIKVPRICNELSREIKKIRDKLIENNLELYGEVKRHYREIKDKKYRDRFNQRLGRNSLDGYFMSIYLEEQEIRIVDKIIEWLYYYTDCLKYGGKNGYIIYENDSILLLKSCVDKCFGTPLNFLDILNRKTKEFFNLPISMEWTFK